MWAFLSFISVFGYYIFNMAPSVTVGDAGEFQTSATILGIAHAPGYPLFSLLGKIFQTLLPFGSYAYRVNALSAFCGSLTAVLFGWWVYLFFKKDDNGKIFSAQLLAFFSSILIASTPALARSSVQTEVFTLNSFFAALVIICFYLVRNSDTGQDRDFFTENRLYLLVFFLLGFASSNHQTIILLFPPVLWMMITRAKEYLADGNFHTTTRHQAMVFSFKNLFRPKFFIALLIAFTVGFSVNLYLIIRAGKEPSLNVGNPSNISRFVRVIRRADYGSLKLTVGEKSDYDLKTLVRQCRRVVTGAVKELTAVGVLLGFAGLILALKKSIKPAGFRRWFFVLLVYIFSVPFFIFMGNLPFDAESEGILERFYVMGNLPLGFLAVTGSVFLTREIFKDENRAFLVASIILICIAGYNIVGNFNSYHWRQNFLAYDYGVNILHSVPTGGALFMDGGDDTFYTTAYLVFAEGRRKDISLFDRGGVVFKSPYGADFRSGILSREEKELRRKEVEKNFAASRPVAFSTFNKEIMPGIRQAGILYWSPQSASLAGIKGEPERIFFEVYSLRDWMKNFDDYRSRSLQPIYSYMENSLRISSPGDKLSEETLGEVLDGFEYCARRWRDVSWLATNIKIELSQRAYYFFNKNNYKFSRLVYERLLSLYPSDAGSWTNLGVVYERLGLDDSALESYDKAIKADSRSALAYYNKAVIYWKRKEWEKVVENFGKVLDVEPGNPAARSYLERARLEMIKKP